LKHAKHYTNLYIKFETIKIFIKKMTNNKKKRLKTQLKGLKRKALKRKKMHLKET